MPAIFLISSTLLAQTQFEIGFTYDDAGNRITREVILLKSPGEIAVEEGIVPDLCGDVHQKVFEGTAGDFIIAVYPNPTRESIMVEISGAGTPPAWTAEVYDSNGGLLFRKEANTGNAAIDLSGQHKGIYFLTILLPDGKNTWKVVKE
ncbi:T9SS type A sorting domain-containing protein [bacterium]|nr:T9SS type A sorting domain-containing protein [bacterium]